MSSRFPPDPRYVLRTRSRSPPRYQEWRPSGPSNPGFSNRHPDFGRGGPEPPRGPKTFNDPGRGAGLGSIPGPSAPLGPRGRGAPLRSEFRELRDAPPLGTDRSFRDREFDRRARPPSPRMRSPVRSFRDVPLPPRDSDLGRGRRDSRDGPLTTGPAYSDTPPFGQSSFGRGGFNSRGRGRGRGDFEFRERGRRGPPDDRSTFRPRDRSPPTRWGSVSRSDRDDWRPERRDEDRWPERDDRERDADRFRREPTSSRFDSRPPTPHQQAPLAPPPTERSAQFESSRDDASLRRPSTTSLSSAVKEAPRRDPSVQPQPPPANLPTNDLLAGRVESSAARYGSRASSPPPTVPQVPAFGSLSFKSQAYSGPTSNVWKASPESRVANPPAPAKAPVVTSPVPKTAPTAPKAQLTAPPPAAPRAPRALEGGVPPAPREPSLDRAPTAPKARNLSAPQPPTAPWALRTEERALGQFPPGPGRENRSLSGSFQPHNLNSVPAPSRVPAPPSKPVDPLPGQMPSHSQPTQESGSRDMRPPRSDMAPPKLGTPPPSAPSGPRNIHNFSTSPVLPNANVPTAPKAIRGPPVAPRAASDRGPPPHRPLDRPGIASSRPPPNAPRAPAWNQWIRPGAPSWREPVVPAKRDASGEEKSPQSGLHASLPQNMVRQVSDPSTVKLEENKDDRASKTAPTSPDREMTDVLSMDKEERFESLKGSSIPSQTEIDQPRNLADADLSATESSEELSDEEGMDLDEEDFAQSKAKFERQKAHLEAQIIDLSAREYRATTPLEHIARLARITAEDLPITTQLLVAPNVTEAEIEEGVGVPLPVTSPAASAASMLQEDANNELLTPKQEEADEGEEAVTNAIEDPEELKHPGETLATAEIDDVGDVVMDGSDALDDIMPEPRPSVEAISLPYLNKAPLTPLSELGAYHDTLARQHAAKPALIAHLMSQEEDNRSDQRALHDDFLERYRDWRLKTQLLDRERADKESEERQMSVELGLDFDSSSVGADNAVSESRSRLHKFSSEYDIQKVLKESEETARLEQERLERESRKAQIDLEKEAVIPDVWDPVDREKNVFKNTNRYRHPVQLTGIYGYEPAMDTFSEAEHRRFLDLFKDRPKKWGEIASQLPGRSYADCIHHYYEFKWDGRFKENKGRRRGKGGGRGRGGKGGLSRARGAPLMADLSRSEEDGSTGPMLTETGRPRRAATRTVYGERETEAKNTTPAVAPGKKGLANGETSTEKPGKRRRTAATGERAAKRGRQTAAPASNASPAGNDKDVVPSKEDLARAQNLEDASLLAGLQTGHRNPGGAPAMEFTHESFQNTHAPIESTERSRASGQPLQQRSSASSYWSVPEQTDFVKFIAHFGNDYGAIANHMGTKTQTMVKNYYQRLVESGNRQDVVDAANLANARRERGEDMGLPPTPTPINKRRYDNPGPALPRSYGSQGEVMDIDPVPTPQPSAPQQASSQFQHQSRFSVSAQPTPIPPQRIISNPLQPSGSPTLAKQSLPAQPRSNPPAGPKMGFFSESRLERRQTMQAQAQERPLPQPSSPHLQQNQTPPALMHQNLSHLTSEFVKSLKEEQDRALSIQKRASQEHVPQVSGHVPMFHPGPGQVPLTSAAAQPALLERAAEQMERPGTPGLSSTPGIRGGTGMFRNIMGSPAPVASPPVALHPPFRSAQVPSPPKREEFRPSSVPAPSPAPSAVKPILPPSVPEPRKTSNLASLLNSEPEEPRPKKRVTEQGRPGLIQSPTPSTMSTATPGPSASIFPPRREVYNHTPVPRSDYDPRPSYPQPSTHVPAPPVPHEHMSGRAATPVGTRQSEWGARPVVINQQLTSSSPHPPAPLEREVRPYFSHRPAGITGMNPQPRHNPSPPPPNSHPFLQQNRTPSLGGRPLTPTQGQPPPPASMQHMAPGQAPQSQSQILQSNPYSQPHVSAQHLQQMQVQQRNELHHRHNSSGSSTHSGLHQRQTSRGEDVFRQQERDYHISREREHMIEVERQHREREAAHFQAQQQQQQQQQQEQQQRYAQHRTPQSYQSQQPMSGPPPMLPLREQARREVEEQYRRDRERYEHEMQEREMHVRRAQQQEEEERMRYDYGRGMMNRSGQGGYGGFPPPQQHRR